MDPSMDDGSTQDSGSAAGDSTATTVSACTWGGGPASRLQGVESDELSGTGGAGARAMGGGGGGHHHSRQHSRLGRHRDLLGSLGTDPDVIESGNVGTPFSFQLNDDGRSQGGTVAGGGGGATIGFGGGGGGAGGSGSPLDWMSSGTATDDPDGVHKRSLNGTSKGVSPGRVGGGGSSSISGVLSMSPQDGGDLIRRVACDDPPGSMPQQVPQVGGWGGGKGLRRGAGCGGEGRAVERGFLAGFVVPRVVLYPAPGALRDVACGMEELAVDLETAVISSHIMVPYSK